MSAPNLTNYWQPLFYSTRGVMAAKDLIETVHQGAISIVDGEGKELFSVGDSSVYVHARSTTKPFQLLPLLMADGVKKFNLNPAQITLLMSSHDSSENYTQIIKDLLSRAGLSENDLQCGSHWPISKKESKRLLCGGLSAGVLHNNCSGKHTGMLLACKAHGWPTANYLDPLHPLQIQIVKLIAQLAELSQEKIGIAVDGCNAPTFVMPLLNLARLYSHLAFHEALDEKLKHILQHIWHCATENPDFLRGPGLFDSDLMQALPGQIFTKTGADGTYAFALAPSAQYPRGLAVAFKIADGDSTHLIRTICCLHLLQELAILDKDFEKWPQALRKYALQFERLNCIGQIVGHMKAAFSL